MNDHDFSVSFFRYFRAFTHYELFISFHSLNFGFKINRINSLLVIISSKLPAITNVIHKLLLWVLQTISLAATYKSNSTTALCWLLPPVTVLQQTKPTMRISIMSSHELFISSPPCTWADNSDYVRSLLSATLLVGSVATSVESCAGWKFLSAPATHPHTSNPHPPRRPTQPSPATHRTFSVLNPQLSANY